MQGRETKGTRDTKDLSFTTTAISHNIWNYVVESHPLLSVHISSFLFFFLKAYICVCVSVHVYLCVWNIVSSYLVIGTERNGGRLVLKSRPLEGEREERGHRRVKILFCCFGWLLRHRRGGLICLKVWQQPSTDSSFSPFFSFCLFI